MIESSPQKSRYSEFQILSEKTLFLSSKTLDFKLLQKYEGLSWEANEVEDVAISLVFKVSELQKITFKILPPITGYSHLIENDYKALKIFYFNQELLPFLYRGLHRLINLETLVIGSPEKKNISSESEELSKVQWQHLQHLKIVELYCGRVNHSLAKLTQLRSLEKIILSVAADKETLKKLFTIKEKISHIDLVCNSDQPLENPSEPESDSTHFPGKYIKELLFDQPYEIKFNENQFPRCKKLTLFHSQLTHETLYSFPQLKELIILKMTENLNFSRNDLLICKKLKILKLGNEQISKPLDLLKSGHKEQLASFEALSSPALSRKSSSRTLSLKKLSFRTFSK